jgi:hypothetical protein
MLSTKALTNLIWRMAAIKARRNVNFIEFT